MRKVLINSATGSRTDVSYKKQIELLKMAKQLSEEFDYIIIEYRNDQNVVEAAELFENGQLVSQPSKETQVALLVHKRENKRNK